LWESVPFSALQLLLLPLLPSLLLPPSMLHMLVLIQ
jgi:hypothetical protein